MTDTLMVAETAERCSVLGPGVRFGLWVQGCSIGCAECISPQWIPASGGTPRDVGELAGIICDHAEDGLTISGGEPFNQAAALAALVRRVRARRDLSVMAYSGYTIERLRRHGSRAQQELLAQLDILVDGPYVGSAHADLLWRGSANQRLHFLTTRHHRADFDDVSAGLQFDMDADGTITWLGVPPVRNFRSAFETAVELELSEARHEQIA